MLRRSLVVFGFIMSSVTFAHDEGHGPKLNDAAKYGGKLAPIIAHSEISQGTKAKMIYKAEFTKNAENIVRIYIYDDKMQPKKDLKIISVSGKIYFKDKATNKMKDVTVDMKLENGEISTQLPKDIGKPFDLDVTIATTDQKLFAAFDGNR